MDKPPFSILFVDDESENLFAFKAAFRREYDVYTANKGVDALNMLKDLNVQLIISDQRMPEMTGVEFLEKVRKEFPDPIRIILTGFSDVEAVIKAINEGEVFRYITKPWDKKELRISIENAREIYDLRERNRLLLQDLQRNIEELQKTVRIFSKYVPEPVVESALKSQEGSMIKGEVREAAVLFCDIRGFTTITERLHPEEVVAFLNDFYSTMTEVVIRHNGSVNQFVGDEIFATFGAPLAYPNNAENALFCAIDMLKKREELNQRYEVKFQQSVDIGIGINYGNVVAGNMGSDARMNYSVIGDTVNTAKRIESMTKGEVNTILVSESLFLKTQGLVEAKPVGPVNLKGKKDAMNLYQIISR